jgi:predicted permease
VDGGFQADHVFTAQVDLDWTKYRTPEQRRAFFRPFLAEASKLAGVRAAALSLTFPLNESAPYNAHFLVEGPDEPERSHRQADFRLASPDYFRTIGMSVLRGRVFTPGDDAGSEEVAVINLSMARHQFGDGEAVGRRLSFDGGTTWTRIVGVVNDVRQYGLASAPADEIYLPFDRRGPLAATLLIRTAGDPMALAGPIRRIVAGLDPGQPVSRPQALDDVRSASLGVPRATATLVSLFAILALAVTAVGIAGAVSFAAEQRTAEFGVRMMLGAPRASVMRMVVGQALAPVAAGLAAGFAAALPASRGVAPMLYATAPADVPTFAAVAAALVAVAALACLGPARRAAAIDPMRTLRAE